MTIIDKHKTELETYVDGDIYNIRIDEFNELSKEIDIAQVYLSRRDAKQLMNSLDWFLKKTAGCKKPLEENQWWGFCGETDMGQTLPALCTKCGGSYKLKSK